MSWRRMRLAVFWVCIECFLCSSETFAYPTLRKEREGWGTRSNGGRDRARVVTGVELEW
jgi:hypothetical protein